MPVPDASLAPCDLRPHRLQRDRGQRSALRARVWRGVQAVVLVLLLLLAVPLPVRAAEAGSPQPLQVKIGAFLTGLGDLDPAKKSFSASYWLWTISKADPVSPLDSLEFPNAIKVESPNTVAVPTPAGIWAQRKVVGSFRHEWNLRQFPFDRQLLRIEMEEANRDTSALLYSADAINSSFDQEVRPIGWRIRSTRLITGSKPYRTSFGDPRLKPGSPSAYARAELQILLERSDSSGFWKLTAGAFAAALMALASYGLRVDTPVVLSPRFGLMAGSVFAAVISLRASTSELGASGYLTLIDAVHAVVLLYIVLATVTGVTAWRWFQREGDSPAIHRMERRMAGFTTLGFGIVILVMVLGAKAQVPF